MRHVNKLVSTKIMFVLYAIGVASSIAILSIYRFFVKVGVPWRRWTRQSKGGGENSESGILEVARVARVELVNAPVLERLG